MLPIGPGSFEEAQGFMITEKSSYSGYIDPLGTKSPTKLQVGAQLFGVGEDFSACSITLKELHIVEMNDGGHERPGRGFDCLENMDEAYNYHIKSMMTRTVHILKRYVPYQKPSLSAYNAPPRGASEFCKSSPSLGLRDRSGSRSGAGRCWRGCNNHR